MTADGNTASGLASQTVCVAPGAIPVSATAKPMFKIGVNPWHDTDGDIGGTGEQGMLTGTGQATVSSTTVTVSGMTACAWVCCEFANGGGCPTLDQCP